MGSATKKLREWARYEFGRCIGNLPGNCQLCSAAHKRLKRDPPCHRCPKLALWPGANYGLHPANTLTVQLYYLAKRDQRVGMEGVLIGTLAPSDALAVIDLYSEHLPTQRSRQRTYELMMVVDDVATRVRGEIEAHERDALAKRSGSRRR